ncbi:hypothetical protein LG3211_5157 [Lysobacter gummosus]|nr:hypothetical protein LG3211_5157 [Lysobacter gummosus]
MTSLPYRATSLVLEGWIRCGQRRSRVLVAQPPARTTSSPDPKLRTLNERCNELCKVS